MAGLDEARGCSREEATPEDEEDEEELLPSQGHEAEGVEGQCWMGFGSLGSYSCWPVYTMRHRGSQPFSFDTVLPHSCHWLPFNCSMCPGRALAFLAC